MMPDMSMSGPSQSLMSVCVGPNTVPEPPVASIDISYFCVPSRFVGTVLPSGETKGKCRFPHPSLLDLITIESIAMSVIDS
jgi:hypothetical protein